MTFADYLKTQRTLSQAEVDRRTAERDRERGEFTPNNRHPEPEAARH